MTPSRMGWPLRLGCAAVATYGFAAVFSGLNQHFDGSAPEPLMTTVNGQYTWYNPIPIHTVEARDAEGRVYRVDVLPELASRLEVGAPLSVVRKRGLFGKAWLEDRQFFESLRASRPVQGALFVAIGGLLAFLWLRESRRLGALRAGAATLGLSALVAFAIFRLWL